LFADRDRSSLCTSQAAVRCKNGPPRTSRQNVNVRVNRATLNAGMILRRKISWRANERVKGDEKKHEDERDTAREGTQDDRE